MQVKSRVTFHLPLDGGRIAMRNKTIEGVTMISPSPPVICCVWSRVTRLLGLGS